MIELTLWPIAVTYNYRQYNKQQYWRQILDCLKRLVCEFFEVSQCICVAISSTFVGRRKNKLEWVCSVCSNLLWYKKSDLIWKAGCLQIKIEIFVYKLTRALLSALGCLYGYESLCFAISWDLEFKLPVYIPFYWEPQILQFFKEWVNLRWRISS